MTRLITITDIQALKPLSTNVNAILKVNTFITEAQEFDLRPLLGDEFYLAIVADFAASPSLVTYADLFNGSEYTNDGIKYQHDGLKAVLIYYSYSRFLNNANTNSTAFGMVNKTNPDSEPISEKALSRLVSQAVSGAKVYEQRVLEFLQRNSEDFPLWKCPNPNFRTGGLRITPVR